MVRVLLFTALLASGLPSAAVAQTGRVFATFGDTDAYRIQEADQLAAAIARRALRRATPAEVRTVGAGNGALRQGWLLDEPVYYVLRQDALPAIAQVAGAQARIFIIPASLRRTDFNSQNVYVTPGGGCLQGACGPCAPTAPAGNRSDQIPGTCMIAIPAAPSAPRR